MAVGLVVEDPDHMQHHEEHHGVRAPAVDIAQEGAVGHHVGQVQHVAVGPARFRHVKEHQQETADGQHQEHQEGQAAHAEGGGETQLLPGNETRVEMQQGVVTPAARTGPEDRSPDGGFGQFHIFNTKGALFLRRSSFSRIAPSTSTSPRALILRDARKSGSGAGPRTTSPFFLKIEPWQGQ